MGHSIVGFVAADDAVAGAFRAAPLRGSVQLRTGWHFAPVTFADYYPIEGGHWGVTLAYDELGAALSVHGPIALIGTDYFGGAGSQEGRAWINGALVAGPGSTINQALTAAFGLTIYEGVDAFDQVGLGHFRSLDRIFDTMDISTTAIRDYAGVVLAGGQARRMGGGDKAMLEVSGRPLLSHVIDRLRPQVAEVAINANGDASRFADFGLPVIADTVDGFVGPLGGVLAGMRWAAKRGHSHIVSAAADTPFFPSDLVQKLEDAKGDRPISMAATDDPERGLSEHPTFALWPVDLADDLERALTTSTMRKVIVWTSRHGCARAVFDGNYPFFNVNTPEDLAEAERIAAR
ncbi:MAG: molybdenum cofactor guanylyltransferase MobA [Pseudomonadota bacterium]